jgi:hypothetical protein
LARASGLYACLQAAPGFYRHHHANRCLLYSDRVAYSPKPLRRVPVRSATSCAAERREERKSSEIRPPCVPEFGTYTAGNIGS